MCELSHLNGVVFDVEVTGGAAHVSGVEVSGALLEADHAGLVQLPSGLHHQLLTVQV